MTEKKFLYTFLYICTYIPHNSEHIQYTFNVYISYIIYEYIETEEVLKFIVLLSCCLASCN